jgi:hypothetical protein
MLETPLDQMDKPYVESLIENQVAEGRHLDYKEALPGDGEKEKNRFVDDICSFANTDGGDVIFGLRDKRDSAGQKTGTPEYAGLKGLNFDQDKLRLEHIILHGVQPRITGIQFHPIDGFKDGPVLIMRIPKSYNAPHMTKHDNRFHSRTDSGSYVMDVQEIRAAFIASETLPERVRRFRADRLAKVAGGDTAVRLNNGPKMVLHVVPLSSFAQKQSHDLSEICKDPTPVVPIGSREFDHRHNFDGLLSYASSKDRSSVLSYTQLFRDGTVEIVEANHIQGGAHEKGITCAYEQDALSAIEIAARVQKRLGIEPPLIVMMSLLGVRGYKIAGWDQKYRGEAPFPGQEQIDRDDLLSDDLVIEQYEDDWRRLMRPIFDAVANAAGWPRSMSYDEEGARLR